MKHKNFCKECYRTLCDKRNFERNHTKITHPILSTSSTSSTSTITHINKNKNDKNDDSDKMEKEYRLIMGVIIGGYLIFMMIN